MFGGVDVGSGCDVGVADGIVGGGCVAVAITVGGTMVGRGRDVGASTPETITVRVGWEDVQPTANANKDSVIATAGNRNFTLTWLLQESRHPL